MSNQSSSPSPVLFEFSGKDREVQLLLGLCTRAIQQGKQIAIFRRDEDLRDQSIAKLRESIIEIGVGRAELEVKVPALLYAYRLFERMRASQAAAEVLGIGPAAAIADKISVDRRFTLRDLDHFLNSIRTNPARLIDPD